MLLFVFDRLVGLTTKLNGSLWPILGSPFHDMNIVGFLLVRQVKTCQRCCAAEGKYQPHFVHLSSISENFETSIIPPNNFLCLHYNAIFIIMLCKMM